MGGMGGLGERFVSAVFTEGMGWTSSTSVRGSKNIRDRETDRQREGEMVASVN